jgi:hypothetical protein
MCEVGHQEAVQQVHLGVPEAGQDGQYRQHHCSTYLQRM